MRFMGGPSPSIEGEGQKAGGGQREGGWLGDGQSWNPSSMVARSGPIHEWHLVLGNAFQDIALSHPSWFHQEVVPLFSPFHSARFITVGTVSDAMNSNRVKQLLVKAPTKRSVAVPTKGDRRLEGFQRLNRSFEAHRARFDAMFCRGLSHDRPDEIVGEDVRPNLLPHQFRRFAA